ncbi:DNA cytosine methyltransferase [Nostoc sp.]
MFTTNRLEVNLVIGGPPCQGFSVAGKRDHKDPRNRLFYEFVRVVSEIRPWYVVMENVPGILTIQNGDVKKAIIEAFESIGYPNISVAILKFSICYLFFKGSDQTNLSHQTHSI